MYINSNKPKKSFKDAVYFLNKWSKNMPSTNHNYTDSLAIFGRRLNEICKNDIEKPGVRVQQVKDLRDDMVIFAKKLLSKINHDAQRDEKNQIKYKSLLCVIKIACFLTSQHLMLQLKNKTKAKTGILDGLVKRT